jgi:transcriptional regulator with XRE-family HTH domain
MPRKKNPNMDQYNSALPTRLRAIIEEKKLIQQDVANQLGISRQGVASYLDGSSRPTWETIVTLAKFFHVSTDWLLGMSDFREQETANMTIDKLGLSETAIKRLVALQCANDQLSKQKMATISLLLADDTADERGTYLLQYLTEFLYTATDRNQWLQFTPTGMIISDKTPSVSNIISGELDLPVWIRAIKEYDQILGERILDAIKEARAVSRINFTEEVV